MRVLLAYRHVVKIKPLIGTLFFVTLFLVNIVLGLSATPAYADKGEVAAQAIFRTVMSPYCPGRLLSDCPSGEAEELRNSIRADIASGKPQEAVIESLLEKFGPSIRGAPEASGIGLLAWLIPIAFPLAGLLIYIGFVRKGEANNECSRII